MRTVTTWTGADTTLSGAGRRPPPRERRRAVLVFHQALLENMPSRGQAVRMTVTIRLRLKNDSPRHCCEDCDSSRSQNLDWKSIPWTPHRTYGGSTDFSSRITSSDKASTFPAPGARPISSSWPCGRRHRFELRTVDGTIRHSPYVSIWHVLLSFSSVSSILMISMPSLNSTVHMGWGSRRLGYDCRQGRNHQVERIGPREEPDNPCGCDQRVPRHYALPP
jgi:hypothetical protein